MNMSPDDKVVPEWVPGFMDRNCFDWFISVSIDGSQIDFRSQDWVSEHTSRFGVCQGLRVPHVFMEIDGYIKLSYDGPLWQAINIINAIGAR